MEPDFDYLINRCIVVQDLMKLGGCSEHNMEKILFCDATERMREIINMFCNIKNELTKTTR